LVFNGHHFFENKTKKLVLTNGQEKLEASSKLVEVGKKIICILKTKGANWKEI